MWWEGESLCACHMCTTPISGAFLCVLLFIYLSPSHLSLQIPFCQNQVKMGKITTQVQIWYLDSLCLDIIASAFVPRLGKICVIPWPFLSLEKLSFSYLTSRVLVPFWRLMQWTHHISPQTRNKGVMNLAYHFSKITGPWSGLCQLDYHIFLFKLKLQCHNIW